MHVESRVTCLTRITFRQASRPLSKALPESRVSRFRRRRRVRDGDKALWCMSLLSHSNARCLGINFDQLPGAGALCDRRTLIPFRPTDSGIRVTETEVPSIQEDNRARVWLEEAQAHGLQDLEIDAEGNGTGIRRGIGNGRPRSDGSPIALRTKRSCLVCLRA